MRAISKARSDPHSAYNGSLRSAAKSPKSVTHECEEVSGSGDYLLRCGDHLAAVGDP